MATYIYTHEESFDLISNRKEIQRFLENNDMTASKQVHDSTCTKTHWTEREIGKIIQHCKVNDDLVCHEASHLTCSTSQVLELLNRATELGINLHFVKYNISINNQSKTIATQKLLDLISKIESEFISKRTTQALARRKAAGLPLGRPKGRGNKSLKLDKHREDIEKYLGLGISKASIAKLVNCHPQTLYDWLDRNKLGNGNDEGESQDSENKEERISA
jgi:DNA invertase Pin-like site-specific DNA recombinase